ncbi:MAG: extracellular solute-binding protein, partial [Microlunatus sp.]|nr:extracellular solute-binding protein [Microlunatus sp.]
YNTKTVTKPPTTLHELLAWIKAHPGKFTYCSPESGGSGGAFATTVLDAYMPADIQQKMRVSYDAGLEKYWDPGFKELRSLNPYVYQKGVYPNGNNQALDLLASGQIDMSPVWSDQFITAQKTGQIPPSVHVAQISDPSFTGGGAYLGVLRTSPVTDLAQKVLEYVLTPEAQTLIAEQIAGYPVIPMSKLPASVQTKFAKAKPADLRPTFFGDFGTDLNNEWDKKVPQ